MNRIALRVCAVTLALLPLSSAQSLLALSSGISATGTTVSLDLNLSSGSAAQPAALQWTLIFPAGVSSYSVAAGPVLTAAGKAVSCAGNAAIYTCQASGLNINPIADGVAATISVTLGPGVSSVSIPVSYAVGVAADGSELPMTATAGSAGVTGPPTVSAVSCTPSLLNPGGRATCSVMLAAAAGSDTSIALGSSTSDLAIPAAVTVPANAATAAFTAIAGAFTADQTAIITGRLNGGSASDTVSLIAPVSISSLQCAATTLAASGSTSCTITISKPAPTGGAAVSLTSSATSALTVPASVTVPGGATTASFTATAAAVTSDQTADVTALLNGTRTVNFNVAPNPALTISSLVCTSATLAVPATTVCRVTISNAAPAGGTAIVVTSSQPASLTVPASLIVPAGATSATFTAASVAAVSNTAVVTATLNNASKTVTFTLNPAFTLSSLACTSSTLAASGSTTCHVTLSSAAPSGGSAVALVSAAPSSLSVPASVLVASGATTATFPATAAALAPDQVITVTASLGGASASFALTLSSPMTVSALQCSLTTLTSNTSTVCGVTLSKNAPAGGFSVAVSTSAPSILTAPASVMIPAGVTSATFTVSSGPLSATQAATVRASIGSLGVSATLTLSAAPPAISMVFCSPTSVTPGGRGGCAVSLTAPSSGDSIVVLKSNNAGLAVPTSLTITSGTTVGAFTYTTTVSLTGSGIISFTLGSVTKSVTISAAGASDAATDSEVRALTCNPRQLAPGESAVCEIVSSGGDPSAAAGFLILSSSERVKAPAMVRGRAGRNRVRFVITADQNATQEDVTLEAHSGSTAAADSVAVLPAAPYLSAPESQAVLPGSILRFRATAVDSSKLPVRVSAHGAPRGAAFDASTGAFEWSPTEADLGETAITFTAVDAVGATSSKTVMVNVTDGIPVVRSLRNRAGVEAPAACVPGSVATLGGVFIVDDAVRVLVNDSAARVVAAQADRVDFLCPEAPPGTSLAISVEVGQRVSNTIQSVMAEAAPGLLGVDGSGKGQGFALHDGVLSALASFRAAGSPTLGGGRLSFYSTGITCGQNFVTKTPLLHFGHDYADIATIRPSGFPGVCEVQTVVPYGVSGDAVQVYLEWVDAAGAATRSNTISVAVDQ